MRWAIVAVWLLAMGVLLAWPTSPGDDLTRRTIYPALVCWALACVLMLRRHPAARVCWSLGCLAYVIHVGFAFHEWHGWSHARAVAHVQERSGFGPGIYFSHLFTLLWTVDVVWWWLAPRSHEQRPAWLGCFLHAYMGFLIFNGTVVYGTGFARWFGVALFVLIAWRLYKDRGSPAPHSGGQPCSAPLPSSSSPA